MERRRHGQPDRLGRRTRRSSTSSSSRPWPTLQQQLRICFLAKTSRSRDRRSRRCCRAVCRATTMMLEPARSRRRCSSKPKVINLLQVPGGTRVSRSCCRCGSPRSIARRSPKLGISLFTGRTLQYDWSAGQRPNSSPPPTSNRRVRRPSDADVQRPLNIFLFNTKYDVAR